MLPFFGAPVIRKKPVPPIATRNSTPRIMSGILLPPSRPAIVGGRVSGAWAPIDQLSSVWTAAPRLPPTKVEGLPGGWLAGWAGPPNWLCGACGVMKVAGLAGGPAARVPVGDGAGPRVPCVAPCAEVVEEPVELFAGATIGKLPVSCSKEARASASSRALW